MTNETKRALMQFLVAEGIFAEGFRDGKAGYVLTAKGAALDKAAEAELCWRFTYQGNPDVVPLQ